MRIEVIIGSAEPLIFPLKESKILIGSAEGSDIVIPSTDGISRKHIQVTVENDNYFVTDLGSSNGSFINDERLVPGTRSEFTSFFPVRLGENVYLSLLSDDEESSNLILTEPEPIKPPPTKIKTGNTKTTILSNSSKSNTKARISQREQAIAKIQTPKKSKRAADSSRMKNTLIMIGLFTAVAIYINMDLTERIPKKVVQANPTPSGPKPTVVEKQREPVLIPDSEIPSLQEIQTNIRDFKCLTSSEKKICELIPDAAHSYGGVFETIGRFIVLVPEDKWYQATIVNEIRTLKQKDYKKRSQLIYLYFQKNLPAFPWKELEKNIYFVFYRVQDDKPIIATVVGIRSDEIEELVSKLPQDFEKEHKIVRKKTLQNYTKYFKVINETGEPEKLPDRIVPTIAAPEPGAEPEPEPEPEPRPELRSKPIPFPKPLPPTTKRTPINSPFEETDPRLINP